MISVVQTSLDKAPVCILMSSSICKDYPSHEEWIKKCRIQKRPTFLCLDEYGQIIGCSIIKESKSKNSIKIGYIYVLSQFENMGNGTKMVKAIIAYAEINKFDKIYTRIKQKKYNVHNFFEKNQFVASFITSDEIVYCKYL